MRKQKTIALSETAKITVLELRPRDIKHALGLMQGGADLDFEKLLTENWDDALAKLGGVIQVDGIELEDLSFSEIAEAKEAFMEVNAAFFDLLQGLGLNLAVAGLRSNATSIAPASSSSSAGTETSSTTVGASS
jgi:hypothetical protein